MTGCVLIILMVVIGGITRLTQSGLSMVKWEPIMGFLPPLSTDEWNETFALYKQSPEFHFYNSSFTLSDFKQIFFWEYLHRLIARIIGLIFIIPCIIFWRKKYFNSRLKKQVLIIFALGALQGVIGWFMVKSGLVDKPHVSHYRLATHLITALGLMIYIFWVAMSVKYKSIEEENQRSTGLLKWFIGLVVLQLIFGAFVAGLKGGYYYNTFPKMGSEWIPSEFGAIIGRDGMISLIESPGIVQLMHRIIAYSIVIVLIVLFVKSRKLNYNSFQKMGLNLLLISVGIQFILGVVTVLYAVPVSLGVLHQFGAILLLLASFYFMYSLKGKSVID